MDRIEDIDINFDSSFLIGLEAQKRGYELFYYNPQVLFYNAGQNQVNGYHIQLYENNKKYFQYLTKKTLLNLIEFKFFTSQRIP